MRKLIFAVALAVVTAVAAFGAAKSQTVTVSAKPGDDLNAKLEELRGKAGAGGGELVLEDGVYVMKSTVAFKASDSNLTVRAKNLGKATLAGGWVFKGADFKKVTDGRLLSRLPKAVREKCVEVAIPAEVYDARVKGFASKPRMPEAMPIFTVDATYQGVSHWPNGRERYYLENTNFVGLAGHEVRDRNGKTSVVSNSVLRLERSKGWDLARSEAFAFGCLTGWGYEAGATPITAAPGFDGCVDFGKKQSCNCWTRVVFFNLLEEIDEPGEWAIDTEAKKIVYLPTEAFKPESVCAFATMGGEFFNVKGFGNKLEGLVMTAKCGGTHTVVVSGRGNMVAGCRFGGVYSGVKVSGFDNTVLSCDFFGIIANCTSLEGGSSARELVHGNNLVENCEMCEFELFDGGYADAAWIRGCGNTVRFCVMHGALGHAADFGGAENVMEYCRIYDVCRDHDDSGAVYANSPASYGSVMRYNDVSASVGMCSGIYLDDFCCGVTLYGNILRNVGHFGVFLSGGRDLTIANNIFTACWGGIRLDNRGLFWDAWKDKPRFWSTMVNMFGLTNNSPFAVKYPRMTKWWDKDGAEMINAPVDNVYLNNLFVDNEGLPTSFLVCLSLETPENRITFKGNLSVRTKGLQPGKNDMASGDPKKVPDNKHTQKPGPNYTYTRAFEVRLGDKVDGGCERIRVLDGTPENPIDLGFVNLPTCIFDLTGFYFDQQGWIDTDALKAKRQKGYAMRPFELGDLSLKPDARLLKEMPNFKPIPFKKIGLYRDKYRTDPSLHERPELDPMPELKISRP